MTGMLRTCIEVFVLLGLIALQIIFAVGSGSKKWRIAIVGTLLILVQAILYKVFLW